MSNRTYDELLREVLYELHEVISDENPIDHNLLPKDNLELMKFNETHYASLYVRYLLIYNKLEECYDQIIQPQKRQEVKEILEKTISKLLEIRYRIISVAGEYIDMDGTLVDLKLAPEALEINIPRYFQEDNAKEMKRRSILLDLLMKRHNIEDLTAMAAEDEDIDTESLQNNMTLQKAILIIQTNERGRQGRQSAKFKKELKQREKRVWRVVEMGEIQVDRDAAATTIQKVWKGYITRCQTRQIALEEAEFLGMKGSEQVVHQLAQNYKKSLKTQQKRKLLQQENEKELQEETIAMRNRILTEEGPRLTQDLHDAILEQVLLYMQSNPENSKNGLPNFPSEEDGGSKTFMQSISNGAKSTESQKESQGDTKLLEESNFQQKFDADSLRNKLMHGENGIAEQFRKHVDNKIREELDNIKLQLETATKTKNAREKKKKSPSKKTSTKTAAPEKKSVEPFLSELVFLGVVKKVPNIKLKDYLGSHHLLGSLLEGWDQPSMGQIRQVMSELILGLGSPKVHQTLTPHVKSVLLFGPEKTGKTMLAYAMANELNATFFDLSPKNIEGRNEGTKETAILIKMVFEVARHMQPAIIYIDDFDCVLKGKGKATKGKKGGTRLKKELLAQYKTLQPGERILIVANSREPWDGDLDAWESFFDRMIYTVIPDYGSCQVLWRNLIEQRIQSYLNGKTDSREAASSHTYYALPESFDIHTLSLLSKSGYTSGNIVKAVKQVLTERRLKRLKNNPLTVDEFVGPLSKIDPVYKKVEQRFKQFISQMKNPKFRKRTAFDTQEMSTEQPKDEKKKTNTKASKK